MHCETGAQKGARFVSASAAGSPTRLPWQVCGGMPFVVLPGGQKKAKGLSCSAHCLHISGGTESSISEVHLHPGEWWRSDLLCGPWHLQSGSDDRRRLVRPCAL